MIQENELYELKEQIDAAKQKVSEITGAKKALLKQLETDYGCKTIEEAQALLSKLKKNREILDKKIETRLAILEEKLSE